MRQSELFTKTQRFAPKDEETVNARFLVRAGYVEKLMAGVYNYLPLGLKVLRKIEQIVREEMDAIGGQEILMAMLHPKEIWEKTGQWKKLDVLFELTSRTGKEYALGQSEEEVVTPLVLKRVQTYKDLPVAVYQIHWKFRDELRSKSGLLRGREFLMKDMYSFHENQEDFERFYAVVKKAYLKIFKRLGLIAKVTEASGGAFSEKISYEFMVLTDAGEDDILYCNLCEFCMNADIAKQKEGDLCPKCGKGKPGSKASDGALRDKNKSEVLLPGKLAKARASEVGNVFDLGQKYGKDFGLTFTGRDGKKHYPVMGCYGIGISRVMGTLVERFHDERGIIWPEAVAPFRAHLLDLGNDSADGLYADLQKAGVEVLYDDRDTSAGVKLMDADLIGIPWRLVVSPETKNKVEVKRRDEKGARIIPIGEVIKILKQ